MKEIETMEEIKDLSLVMLVQVREENPNLEGKQFTSLEPFIHDNLPLELLSNRQLTQLCDHNFNDIKHENSTSPNLKAKQ